jgi:hypothetical protein
MGLRASPRRPFCDERMLGLSPSADFERMSIHRVSSKWRRAVYGLRQGFRYGAARLLNPISCSLRLLEIAFQSDLPPRYVGLRDSGEDCSFGSRLRDFSRDG